MNRTITIALIVAVSSQIGPVILAIVQSVQRRKEQKIDWERQDEVAARLSRTTSETIQRLDVIHTLVNSDMTKALRGQLTALKAQLVLMHDLPNDSGLVSGTMKEIQVQVQELEETLAKREETATLIAEQQEAIEEKG